MTREEMLKRIDEIEKCRFYLAMKDRWNNNDFDLDRKWFGEWLALKRKVEKSA